MKILKKAWYHLEEVFLIPSLMVSVALVFIQVIMRYVFNNSLTWSDELVRYLYVWQTWVGVSYAARNGSHLRITMFKDRLSKSGQRILELFVTAVWILFALFVCYQGCLAIKTIRSFGQKSAALKIPMQFCYLSIPVGLCLMCVRLIEHTVRNYRKNADSTEGGVKE